MPHLEENFLAALRDHAAGDPMRPEVKWTDLAQGQIAGRLAEAGTPASTTVVKRLLRKHGFVRRKARESRAMGRHPDRSQQFENIARPEQEYAESGNPVLSIDTEEKELLGNSYREGRLDTREVVGTFDHDFPSAASGVIIPHGLDDLRRDQGHVNLGSSHDTSEFACDRIRHRWESRGRAVYPRATSLLLPCVGGGSNGASQNLLKEGLQRLADRMGIELRVAHYPR